MKNKITKAFLLVLWSFQTSAAATGDAIAEGLKNLKGPALATVAVTPPRWVYTVTNNSPKNSGQTINSFNFDLYGPADAIELPDGWTVDSDGKKYILWATEKRGIRPGESLKFVLKSSSKHSKEAYAMIGAWDTKANKAGPVSASVIKIPSSK